MKTTGILLIACLALLLHDANCTKLKDIFKGCGLCDDKPNEPEEDPLLGPRRVESSTSVTSSRPDQQVPKNSALPPGVRGKSSLTNVPATPANPATPVTSTLPIPIPKSDAVTHDAATSPSSGSYRTATGLPSGPPSPELGKSIESTSTMLSYKTAQDLPSTPGSSGHASSVASQGTIRGHGPNEGGLGHGPNEGAEHTKTTNQHSGESDNHKNGDAASVSDLFIPGQYR